MFRPGLPPSAALLAGARRSPAWRGCGAHQEVAHAAEEADAQAGCGKGGQRRRLRIAAQQRRLHSCCEGGCGCDAGGGRRKSKQA
jgi:hypothetical protein